MDEVYIRLGNHLNVGWIGSRAKSLVLNLRSFCQTEKKKLSPYIFLRVWKKKTEM